MLCWMCYCLPITPYRFLTYAWRVFTRCTSIDLNQMNKILKWKENTVFRPGLSWYLHSLSEGTVFCDQSENVRCVRLRCIYVKSSAVANSFYVCACIVFAGSISEAETKQAWCCSFNQVGLIGIWRCFPVSSVQGCFHSSVLVVPWCNPNVWNSISLINSDFHMH